MTAEYGYISNCSNPRRKHIGIPLQINSARLGIIANQFYFEMGSFVYHLNVLQAESVRLFRAQ